MNLLYQLSYSHLPLMLALIGAALLSLFFWAKPFEVLTLLLFLRPIVNITRGVGLPTPLFEVRILWIYSLLIIFFGYQYIAIHKQTTLPKTLLMAYSVFFIWCLFSLTYTSSLFWGIGDFLRLFSSFIYLILFHELIKEKRQMLQVIKMMILSFYLTLPFAIHNLIWKSGFVEKTGLVRILSTFRTPNAYASYLLFITLITFFAILRKEFKAKLLLFFTFLLSTLALVLTWTRTGWIAFFSGFLVFMWLKNKKYVPFIIILTICLLSLPPIYGRFLESFQSTSGRLSSWESRLIIWKGLLKGFKNSPIWGFGLGSRFHVAAKYIGGRGWPHNDYLRLLVELGLIGFLEFSVIIGVFLKLLLPTIKQTRNEFLKDLNILSVAILVAFCINSIATNQLTDVTMLMFLSSLLGITLKANQILINNEAEA